MTTDRFQQLLAAANPSEQAELKLAHNGRIEAMQKYQNKPGKQAKEDLDAARDFYNETIATFSAKYFPEQTPAPEGERFANRKQAFDWLISQGYKVSRGKFYNDCEAGRPAVHRDKTVSRFQVLQYGQQLDLETRTSSSDLSQREQELKIQKLENDIKKQEIDTRKEDRLWMLVSDAEAEQAAIVGILRDALEHRFYIRREELILSAGGTRAKIGIFTSSLSTLIKDAFNEIANIKEHDVEFEEETYPDEAATEGPQL